MTASFSGGNLVIQTLAEALEERIVAVAAALSLTAEQAQRFRTDVRSVLGNLVRIEAEADVAWQEALAEVFLSLSWNAEGVRLDAVAAILGLEREALRTSEVIASTDGVATTVIPAGTIVRYNPTGSLWAVQANAAVPDPIVLVSENPGAADEVALSGGDEDDWTVMESIPGWSDAATPVTATEQPIVGRPVETDAQLRTRGAQEAYRRGQGPYAAIEGSVQGVDGVTFVRAYDNPEDDPVDGIPARNAYVVVEGGSDADVAAAIWAARGAGIRTHGTDIVETITTGPNRSVTIRADRVANVDVWVRATLTTSTSEIPAPDNLAALAGANILAAYQAAAAIGADVLPRRGVAALDGIAGIDLVVIELSLDGAAWSTAKRAMDPAQRAAFEADHVEIVEV